MATEDIDVLRAYYDSHDTTADLEKSELDESVVDEPMVGITIRLPASALDAAREVARERGIKVTALLREWIEQNLGDEAGDDRLVSVRDLRSLIAQKSKTTRSGSEATSRRATSSRRVGKTASAGTRTATNSPTKST
jgi:hypothetical protein